MGQMNDAVRSTPTSEVKVDAVVKIGQLPRQLLDYVTICLEEQLYSQAFALLSQNLPHYLPTSQYLSLASTLIVHPALTTRTNSSEKHLASDQALNYLRQVSRLGVDRTTTEGETLGSELAVALSFDNSASPRTLRIRNRRTQGNQSPNANSSREGTPPTGRVNLALAGPEGLFAKAEDFWKIVGWAFNCSVVHRARWRRWKLWLELMIEILENDLASCIAGLGERTAEDALLTQYLAPFANGRDNKRAIMRAVLADGSDRACSEFPEIWHDETKLPKKDKYEEAALKKRRERLDIELDIYGDYYENSEDDSDNEPDSPSHNVSRPVGRPVRARRAPTAASASSNAQSRLEDERVTCEPATSPLEEFGGIDALHLRHQLLSLLSQYCASHPVLLCDLEDLIDLYTEFLKPLPLQIFRHFVLPARQYLDVHTQSALAQTLLRPLLVKSAPRYDKDELTQEDFQRAFAPFPANSTSPVENAKVAILVESSMRLLWRVGWLNYTVELEEAVEKGIQARKDKAAFDGRRKGTNETESLRAIEESAGRMRICLKVLSHANRAVGK